MHPEYCRTFATRIILLYVFFGFGRIHANSRCQNEMEPPILKRNTTTNAAQVHSKAIQNLAKNNYSLLRPNFAALPDNITVSMDLLSIGDFNDVKGTYSIKFTLSKLWHDKRLSFPDTREGHIVLPYKTIDNIWTPDTYCSNMEEGSARAMQPRDQMAFIWPDGNVLLHSRYAIAAYCILDLHRFPMDKQKCSLRLRSYGYNTQHVIYRWNSSSTYNNVYQRQGPIPTFALQKIETSNELQKENGLGLFSVLVVTFHFKRLMDFYALHIYLPSILLVMLSWVSFWLRRDQASARVSIGVTTTLSIVTLNIGIQSSLPNTAYARAIDWYALLCCVCIFGAVLEYAIVHYCSKDRRSTTSVKYAKTTNNIITNGSNTSNGNETHEGLRNTNQQSANCYNDPQQHLNNKQPLRKPSIVDRLSRLLFPSFFIGCNIIYWSIFLT